MPTINVHQPPVHGRLCVGKGRQQRMFNLSLAMLHAADYMQGAHGVCALRALV